MAWPRLELFNYQIAAMTYYSRGGFLVADPWPNTLPFHSDVADKLVLDVPGGYLLRSQYGRPEPSKLP